MCPLIHLFKVNMNKSECILQLLDNRKMKRNWKLITFRYKIAAYRIIMRKGADILKLLKTKRNLLFNIHGSVHRSMIQ